MTDDNAALSRVAAALYHARQERGWSQAKAAREAGIERNTYARAEKGAGPSQDYTLRAIENAFGWAPGYLSRLAAGRAEDGSIPELAGEPLVDTEHDPGDAGLRDAHEQSLAFGRAARAAGADEGDVREFVKLAYDLLRQAESKSMRPETGE